MSFIIALILMGMGQAKADLYRGDTGEKVNHRQIIDRAGNGHIVLMGEHHGFSPSYENQRDVLLGLAELRAHVSVGLEFFEKQFQPIVDRYVVGEMDEAEFLKTINWGTVPFDHYRFQAQFPQLHFGKTLALNARRALTGKVAKQGLESLTDAERAELPLDFALGNDSYKERFRQVMSGHAPEEVIERYFAAQSVWDDVMADTACSFIKNNPEQTLMIIVGDFHVAYGGGLPDRLRVRGCTDLTIVSQANDVSEVSPHPQYGLKGDFVFVDSPAQSSIDTL